jgi:hypothetical protein
MAKKSPSSPDAPKAVAKKTVRPSVQEGSKFTYEQVAVRAYEIYLRRCQTNQPGDAIGDWAAAEAELKGEKVQPKQG